MSLSSRALFGLATLLVAVSSSSLLFGQATQPPPPPSSPPAAPPATNSLPTDQKKPPEDPKILEDGGISVEPIYWLTRAQPTLKGGLTTSQTGVEEELKYGGHSKPSIGGEIGIPAGRANTLRFSYFRVQGNANKTLSTAQTYFSEAYSAGDFLTASYTIQAGKISWDYLSYTWYHSKVKFKTLYEIQYVTISTETAAPFVAVTTDASGNTDTNSSHGSKNLFLPTFGVEFEQPVNKHLRWEAKASGFGLPKHSVIWDAQADLAFRVSAVELLVGARAFHFKTGPGGAEYFYDTLDGAYVGLRYYWGQLRK